MGLRRRRAVPRFVILGLVPRMAPCDDSAQGDVCRIFALDTVIG